MNKVIEISQSLYECLGELAQPFETPEEVITRLVDSYEPKETELPESGVIPSNGKSPNSVKTHNKLNINFMPEDPLQFKNLLLKEKKAWVLLHMVDGTKHLHEWNALRFTEHSNVLGNLRSGYLRHWRKKGIVKAEISIDKRELN